MNQFLIITACLICTIAKSQISFVKGYLLNEKGDTLKGEIKINPKKEHDNNNKVFFKDEQGIQKNYKPNKVKGYGYNNNHYASMDCDGELKFYKVIAKGEISMFKMFFEEVNMNETNYVADYFLMKEGDKKMTDVKPSKLKKQLQEMMSGAASYASEYKGEKDIDEASAAQVINAYNNRAK
ncbi:MAG: hypothetical protein IM600_14095 [Bacteroidetes bacterium]|nr:hypothetical protein [Bacteroidota bacterium]MCA6444559.1 hypothetical protein [Bacteroidota bacterium]